MDKQKEIQTKSTEKQVLEVEPADVISLPSTACAKEFKLTRIGAIRDLVHASLTEGAKPSQENVSLKMLQDVKMSIPVQRQGVVINVLQQAVFNTNVVNNLIGVLKVVDELEKHISKEKPSMTLEDVCLRMIKKGTTWKEFKDIASRAYIVAAIEDSSTVTEAAERMGVGKTYIYRMLHRHGFIDDETGIPGDDGRDTEALTE